MKKKEYAVLTYHLDEDGKLLYTDVAIYKNKKRAEAKMWRQIKKNIINCKSYDIMYFPNDEVMMSTANGEIVNIELNELW